MASKVKPSNESQLLLAVISSKITSPVVLMTTVLGQSIIGSCVLG